MSSTLVSFPRLPRKRARTGCVINRELILCDATGLPQLETSHQRCLWRRSLQPGDRLKVLTTPEYRLPYIEGVTRTWSLLESLLPMNYPEDSGIEWVDTIVILRTATVVRLHIVSAHPSRDCTLQLELLPTQRVQPARFTGPSPSPVFSPFYIRNRDDDKSSVHVGSFRFKCRLAHFYPAEDAFQDFAAFRALCNYQEVIGSETLLQVSSWQPAHDQRPFREILRALLHHTSQQKNLPFVDIVDCTWLDTAALEDGWNYYELTIQIRCALDQTTAADVDLVGLLSACWPDQPGLSHFAKFRNECLTWEECGSNLPSLLHLSLPLHFQPSSTTWPAAAQLKTELRDYQKQSVLHMLKQEQAPNGIAGVFGVPLKIRTQEYWLWVHTQRLTKTLPSVVHGGFLADDMGLGKTVEILALIVLNPPPAVIAGEGKEEARPKGQATLILAPTSLIGQWAREINHHVSGVKVAIWCGRLRKRKTLEQVAKENDIVLSSYAIFQATPTDPTLEWYRLVCDEGHRLTHTANLTSKVAQIRAARRWIVTGTPMRSAVADIKGMMQVLKCDDMVRWERFRSVRCDAVTHHHHHHHHPHGGPVDRNDVCFLHLLFGQLMIRHLKDQTFNGRFPLLLLPPHREQTIEVTLNDSERVMYQRLHQHAVSTLLRNGGRNSLQILLLIFPLRHLCSGGRLPTSLMHPPKGEVLPFADQQPFNAPTEECAICYELMDQPVQTLCRHAFCAECINGLLSSAAKQVCPICRRVLKAKDLRRTVMVGGKKGEAAEETKAPAATHVVVRSKIDALIQHLKTARAQDPFIKVLVFTHFRQTLDFLLEELPCHGFRCHTLRGDMSIGRRQKELDGFQERQGSAVLLLSMRTGNCGVSLTTANHVCIMEPWINPAMEEQAINRVLRIGQTRPVVISRFVTKDTVEEGLRARHSLESLLLGGS